VASQAISATSDITLASGLNAVTVFDVENSVANIR